MKNSILGLTNDLNFYFYSKPVNMAKGIEGLKGLVINDLGMDPMNGDVFIFCSGNHKQVKLLYYNDNAYTLYTRRVYKGFFIYPNYKAETDSYTIDWQRLRRMLTGFVYRKVMY